MGADILDNLFIEVSLEVYIYFRVTEYFESTAINSKSLREEQSLQRMATSKKAT